MIIGTPQQQQSLGHWYVLRGMLVQTHQQTFTDLFWWSEWWKIKFTVLSCIVA
jgi:hypothetical protein